MKLKLLAVTCLLACFMPQYAQAKRAPNLEFKDLAGKSHAVAELRGSIAVVNFWATWCGPCRHEMPRLDHFARTWRPRGVEVVGIALDDSAHVKDFLKKTPVSYPLWIAGDDGMDLLPALGDGGIVVPFTVLLNRQGKPVARWTGEVTDADLNRALTANP